MKDCHLLFDKAHELPYFDMLTSKQISKAYLFEKNYGTELLRSGCKRLAEKHSQVWSKVSILKITLWGRELQLQKYRDDLQKVMQPKSATLKWEEIVRNLDTLFNICSYKCKEFSSCCRPLNLKVPAIERDFLTDQHTVWVGQIAGIDKKESASWGV